MKQSPQSIQESGFTLVELAVVLVIIGLLIGAITSFVTPYLDRARRNTTQTKLENISRQLALYAQNYGRLPCPGEPGSTDASNPPYGAPRKSGINGTDIGSDGCGAADTATKGMVPFRVLDLNESQIRDAWGNLFTYTVSPALVTFDPTGIRLPSEVHEKCRKSLWIEGGSKNLHKAEICCVGRPATSTADILGFTDGSLSVTLFNGRPPRRTLLSTTAYDSPHAAAAAATDTRTRMIAFPLISHGENGEGAFIAHEPGRTPTANASALESFNNANTLNFTDHSRSTSVASADDYFDDIVLWRTNDQLISAFGNDSCARP